jgi:hypothetical protein
MMKSALSFIAILIPLFIYAQKQVKVDWPSLANSPWPVLRGDMQGTGRSEFVGPRSYKIKWIRDIPRGVLYGPVIGYDDNLYMGERAAQLTDTNNFYYAVNKNGQDLWTFSSRQYFPNNGGTVLARDSTIYFHSASGILYALNKDGKLKWSIYAIRGSWFEFYLDKSGNIYLPGFDTLHVVSPEGVMTNYYYPQITPAMSFSVGGDTIFAETGSPNLHGPGELAASDLKGNIYWTYKFGVVNWGIPLVDNQNNIYLYGADTISEQNKYLFCIKPDGSLKWKYPMQNFMDWNAPTMDHNGNITFLTSFWDTTGYMMGSIVSLDYNGNLRWIDTLRENWYSAYMQYGAVCDKEGKIYCGSNIEGGYFYCIDTNGVILWKTIFPYMYDSCPAIGSDGTLYIGTQGGSLFINNVKNLLAITDTLTDVKDEELESVKDYQLYQNYPNPFNPSTTINYSLPKRGIVKLTVYNILGSKVATIINEYKPAGNYSVQINGSNLASGVYLYRLESGNYSASKKFILMK